LRGVLELTKLLLHTCISIKQLQIHAR
jgi:hypothetical protein